MSDQPQSIIKIRGLKKDYVLDGGRNAPVLMGIDLDINAKDFTIIYGPSGCGKSTLLHTMVGLEVPTAGTVLLRGTDIYQLSEEKRSVLRAQKFGMVYQTPYWIKALSVWENVAMPLLISGEKEPTAKKRALAALDEVQLTKFAHKRPTQLSGGEQQRVGLARALINDPWIVIADEPTGSLDTHGSDVIMQLFLQLNLHRHRTIVMVTHNLVYLPMASKQVAMRDGSVISTNVNGVKESIMLELQGVLR